MPVGTRSPAAEKKINPEIVTLASEHPDGDSYECKEYSYAHGF